MLALTAAAVFAADVWLAWWFWRTLPIVGPLGWKWLACACLSGLLLVPALATIMMRANLRQLAWVYGVALLLGALPGLAIMGFFALRISLWHIGPIFLLILWWLPGILLCLGLLCSGWLLGSWWSRRISTLADKIWSTLAMSCVVASGVLLFGCVFAFLAFAPAMRWCSY